MKEEKTVSLKEVFIFLIGNKWHYLIMFISFLAVSLVGFNIASSSKREYSCFFECDLPGFHSDINDEKAYFVDGEKFEPRSLLAKEKMEGYLSVSYLFDGLTYDEITDKCGIKSFEFKAVYKENEDGDKTIDKQGFEIIYNPSVINVEQAKLFSKMIVNEVIVKSNTAVENLNFSTCLDSYNLTNNYEAKIKCLSEAIKYLVGQADSLVASYGDFRIDADKYGGKDEKFYLKSQSIVAWETEMKTVLGNFDADALVKDLKVNGYIDASQPDYIDYLKAEVESLNRDINVKVGVLDELKTERDNLVTLSGSEENAKISEFNEEIIILTEKIAAEREQADICSLQLEKVDPSFIASSDYATYSANLTAFENKLTSIREKLDFYIAQYEDIAQRTMVANSHIYFDSSNIITINAGMGKFAMLVYSLLIATFLPMGINGCIAVFKSIESKPLFKKKSKED